ncbi:MAG: tripartite tricarboxylate transporter substrate binding protein [Burkholderiales bacterium]|nr:tripartite tricarboxylate transporter substrate binding protein [Burkholderiales bacterium]
MENNTYRGCCTARAPSAPACIVALTVCLVPAHTQAQVDSAYPTRPLRIIVPFPPGGSNDIVGRYIGQKLTARLGQQIVIDNRAGADAIIGTHLAATAAPDGHTLLIISTTHTMTPATHKKLPYDPVRSFTPVALIGTGPVMVATFPGLQLSSLKDLITLARAKPGALHYASSSAGGVTQFAGELFNMMAGTKLVHVAYKGGGPAIADVVGGHVPVLVNTLAPVLPHVRAGRLKIHGVGSARRTAVLPEVPTIAEAGVPGYEASIWWGILGPAKLPRPIAARINAQVSSIVREAESVKWFAAQAADPLTATPEEFGQIIAADLTKWAEVAKKAGLSVQ